MNNRDQRHPHISTEQLAKHAAKNQAAPKTRSDTSPASRDTGAAEHYDPAPDRSHRTEVPASTAPRAAKKRHTVRNIILALVGALVLGVGVWDVLVRVRGGDGGATTPTALTTASSAAGATPIEVNTVIAFVTAFDTKTSSTFCSLVAHPERCKTSYAGLPIVGLRSKVNVLGSAVIPPTAEHPEAVAVMVSAITGENTAAGSELHILRRSDRKMIAWLPDLSRSDEQQPINTLAVSVLNGSHDGGVQW